MEIDTGTKMIHIGKNTHSFILSKSIVSGRSYNTFRSIVNISKNAINSSSKTNCDTYIIGSNKKNKSIMLPKFIMSNNTSLIDHEAKNSFLSQEKEFFCKSRSFDTQKILHLLIYQKLQTILDKLPDEFAMEAKMLIKLYLKKSLG